MQNDEAILARCGAELRGRRDVELEFGLRIGPGSVADRGRFTVWCPLDDSGIEQVAAILSGHNAPADVRDELRRSERPVRTGIGADLTSGSPEYRLYLHDRNAATSANRYRAWKWRAGGSVRSAHYTFHYLPETPEGVRPESLLDPAMHGLLSDERLRRTSGFWLRHGDHGTVDQLDLAFPWSPPVRTIPGFSELARHYGVTMDPDLCVRHAAFAIGSANPSLTLYASAPAYGAWPHNERELQEIVRRRSQAIHAAAESSVFSALPELPSMEAATAPLNSFYDGEIELWQRLLGPELHYHHGLFENRESDLDDRAMNAALRRGVTELYPFIPQHGRVYDVGCGWGGPLSMLARDLGCVVEGLTVSRRQFQYASRLGLPVRWGDAERTLPPGSFDCALLLESFEHIVDKERLLRVLRVFAKRLIMRVNCQDLAPPSVVFGDTIHVIPSRDLSELLERTGWRTRHWQNRRDEALPSVTVWGRRLCAEPVGNDAHAEALRAWCGRVLANREAWAQANPLIEVVAE